MLYKFVNCIDEDGNTPLMLWIRYRKTPIPEKLITNIK